MQQIANQSKDIHLEDSRIGSGGSSGDGADESKFGSGLLLLLIDR